MKHKNNKLKYILWTVMILSLFVLVLTSYKQIGRIQASKKLQALQEIKINSTIEEVIVESNISDAIETLIQEPETKQKYSKIPNPQKQWIEINNDYQGWVKVNGTQIDYPVVKSSNNVFYLDKDFFKEHSDAGSIFMDYRNIGSFKDKHTAIYGHYQGTGEMFADLHKYKDYQFAAENNIITFDSLYGEKEFEIFSVYIDSADNYELKLRFEDDLSYENYLNDMNQLSIYELDVGLNPDKLLLTLATCSYEIDNGRIIVHAIEK